MTDIIIPGVVKQAGQDAIDDFVERVAICIVDGGLSLGEALAVAMKDFRKNHENGSYSGLT